MFNIDSTSNSNSHTTTNNIHRNDNIDNNITNSHISFMNSDNTYHNKYTHNCNISMMMMMMLIIRAFKDVVFEDVVFDENSCATPLSIVV